jgi:hypothetical protein
VAGLVEHDRVAPPRGLGCRQRVRSGSPDLAAFSGAPSAPADVKGSTTVAQVVAAFPAVTVADVLTAFSTSLEPRQRS